VPNGSEVTRSEYQALAELRYQIRRFLRFSEDAAQSVGLEPQQHQLLLAIKGFPGKSEPTIRDLAERLQLRHHSVVGLIDRLVDRKLVERIRSEVDRREVCIRLTELGESSLHSLADSHRAELQNTAPALAQALSAVVNSNHNKPASSI
jgi:DNA-binding MarR family transcriptional regulator